MWGMKIIAENVASEPMSFTKETKLTYNSD